MAYTPQFAPADMSAATIDLIISVVAGLVSFGTLIGLVLLWGWLRRQNIRFG